jgi:parvulin-like peptidyl-prolyl isomerase
VKKKIYISVIGILSLSLLGCNRNNIASVNGVNITKAEYEKVIEVVNTTNNYRDGKYSENIGKVLRKENKSKMEESIISFLIDHEVVYQVAKEKGLTPTEEDINLRYEDMQKSINYNLMYKKAVENIDIGKEYLLQAISKDLAVEKYQREYKSNIEISDDEIANYYNENKDKFNVAEVNVSHILISTLDQDEKEVSDEEKVALKEKAQEALQKINEGQRFEELAKIYSDDKSSGKNGGNIGYISKENKNIEFTKKAFKLEAQQVSNIIQTSYGYHIIKVNDKRER